MIGLVFSIVALAVVVAAALWVEGIDYIKDNHPDYKGKDLFNEQEEDEQNIKYNIAIFKVWFKYILLKIPIKMDAIEFLQKSYKATKREENLINRVKKINNI
jgi:hypothetical protein